MVTIVVLSLGVCRVLGHAAAVADDAGRCAVSTWVRSSTMSACSL
jgi:hypothetical protein